MATLEDRIYLLERLFKSYYADDEMFYLLNESIESPERRQRHRSSNASCQEIRFTRFFCRVYRARSSSRRKRWVRVPNAGHRNDHLSTSSASPHQYHQAHNPFFLSQCSSDPISISDILDINFHYANDPAAIL